MFNYGLKCIRIMYDSSIICNVITSSYNRPVIVNSTWGVKNLLEAMEKGNQLNTLTKEDLKEIRKVTSRKLTSEQIERIKDKYSD